ncbi:MAG TPA: VCBS repeat-containing protein [Vicinamibacterales bacterium]|nr:VCBS repeat-containing protein [Vicinamibacterales bacterium]
MFAFAAGAAAQPVTLVRNDYLSVSGARAIVSADFNRDGAPDLAQANNGRNTVTILLNNHDGGFIRGLDVAVGAGPFAMATADFNRDAIPDLAVANADGNSISVLLGNGDGSFSRSDIAADAQNPRGIVVGDVNNDGRLDLIYSAYATGAVQVLIGDGAGRFSKGVTYSSAAQHPQGLAAADFDHDGHLDVAVAYASTTGLRILYGNGGTAFTARTVPGEANLNVLATGDFNRDGWMDVAAASTANDTVTIYEGTAAGLVRVTRYPVGASPRGIVVADVNDDGLLDIATAGRGSNTVTLLIGDRNQFFLPPREAAANSGSRAVAAADFDGDGLLDLATANEFASSTTVLTNRTPLDRAGYAFSAASRGTGNECCASSFLNVLATADFNRDGKVDIATIEPNFNKIELMLYPHGIVLELPVATGVSAFRVADFNADGIADVLYVSIGGPSATVGVFIGDGQGHFTPSPTTAMINPFVSPSIVVGDLNRDGRPDLVSVGAEGDARQPVLQLLLGRGDGTFQIASQVALHTPRDVVTDVATLADVDRDGRLDVVMRSGQIWLGDGAGGVAAIPVESGVRIDAMADVNGDGYLDAVSYDGSGVTVSLGRAGGFAPAIATGTPDFGEGAFSVGDLNADGRLDVVVASGDLMLGNGDGTFAFGGRFDFGAPFFGSATSVLVVEQSGNGLPDIVTSFATGQVRVLTNERTSVNTPPTVDAGPDRTIEFADTAGEDCPTIITAIAADADAHFLSYEWRDASGALVSDQPGVPVCTQVPGARVFSVTVRDGRGGVARDTVTVTRVLTKEIVLWAADAEEIAGPWTTVGDPTAAGGARVYDPNLGRPKVNAPLVDPPSRVTIRFYPEPTLTYKLWVRLKADGNFWANDSVWLQFSGAADASGTPKYQVFSNTGLAINLEECSGCGESGWGWEDDGWGAVGVNGVMLRFPNPDHDPQHLLIQTREDGVSIDQIVLSAERYVSARPGTAKNDATILPSTRPPR